MKRPRGPDHVTAGDGPQVIAVDLLAETELLGFIESQNGAEAAQGFGQGQRCAPAKRAVSHSSTGLNQMDFMGSSFTADGSIIYIIDLASVCETAHTLGLFLGIGPVSARFMHHLRAHFL